MNNECIIYFAIFVLYILDYVKEIATLIINKSININKALILIKTKNMIKINIKILI